MNPPIPESELELIRNEILAGRKIQAIKLYREATGLELATSKRAVEAMEAEMRATSPDQFQRKTPPNSGGCGPVFLLVLVLLIAAGAAWAWMKFRPATKNVPASPPTTTIS